MVVLEQCVHGRGWLQHLLSVGIVDVFYHTASTPPFHAAFWHIPQVPKSSCFKAPTLKE